LENSYKEWINSEINSNLDKYQNDPQNIETLLELGKLYRNLQDEKNSKKFLKKILQIEPNSYVAYYYLGDKGYNHLYFPHLYKSIKLANENNDIEYADMVSFRIAEYYKDAGWECLDSNHNEKAKQYFTKAIKVYPKHTDSLNGLGCYYYDTKQNYEKAKSYYQQALESSEQLIKEMNETKEKILYWGVLETRPYMRSLHGLGICNYKLGNKKLEPNLLDESLKIFNKMLKLNPNDNQGIRYLIPDVYQKKGDYDKSLKKYLKIIKDEGSDYNSILLLNLSILYYKLSDLQNAEKYFLKGMKKNKFYAIFLLKTANKFDFENEIIRLFGEFNTDNFWKNHQFEYIDAYEFIRWSWDLWIDTNSLEEYSSRFQFYNNIYNDNN